MRWNAQAQAFLEERFLYVDFIGLRKSVTPTDAGRPGVRRDHCTGSGRDRLLRVTAGVDVHLVRKE